MKVLQIVCPNLSSAQKSQKVVAVVDPCAAKFGDGLTLVMVLHWQNNRKNIAHKSQEQIEGSTEA
jgi:hypothetical protein